MKRRSGTLVTLCATAISMMDCAGAAPWSSTLVLDSVGAASSPVEAQSAELSARAQAAVEFQCPASSLAAQAVGVQGSSEVFRVQGCGHRGVFIEAYITGVAPSLPGFGRSEATNVLMRRFVRVAEQVEPALALLARDASALRLTAQGVAPGVGTVDSRTLRVWVALGQAAARELACPFDALELDVVSGYRGPGTYLAEGCGWRGQFVRNSAEAFVLTARVRLAPEPAR